MDLGTFPVFPPDCAYPSLIPALSHLASRWESTFLPPTHPYHSFALHKRRMDPTPTVLSTIEHLVLLDLLGSAGPTIMQWYRETGWLFGEMKRADERLRKGGLVERGTGGEWFSPLSFQGTIEDDQVPVSLGRVRYG